jgi:hypothetical protein
MDEGMASGAALSVPRPPPPDRDLELDHRLEPVDVRALEQSDLDESHRPRRITSADGPVRFVSSDVGERIAGPARK